MSNAEQNEAKAINLLCEVARKHGAMARISYDCEQKGDGSLNIDVSLDLTWQRRRELKALLWVQGTTLVLHVICCAAYLTKFCSFYLFLYSAAFGLWMSIWSFILPHFAAKKASGDAIFREAKSTVETRIEHFRLNKLLTP